MIYIPRGHGLLYDFAHALHDAMFIPDKEDKDRISVFAASLDPPQTWATLLCYCPHSCGNIASELFLHQKFCIQWLQKSSILMGH
jgi:hypothetical protein